MLEYITFYSSEGFLAVFVFSVAERKLKPYMKNGLTACSCAAW